MKGLVIKGYIDRDTKASCKIGEKVEYSVPRARELAEKGFIKLEDVPKAEPEATDVETPEEPKPVPKPKRTSRKTTKKKESR